MRPDARYIILQTLLRNPTAHQHTAMQAAAVAHITNIL